MSENISFQVSEQRPDTSIIQFNNQAWTWAEFDDATKKAFAAAETGSVFIISDLRKNGAYLPKGRTALGATSFVTKNMPDNLRYWVIVGPAIVQSTLSITRKLFPNVRFVGVKSLEEAYTFIEKSEASSTEE